VEHDDKRISQGFKAQNSSISEILPYISLGGDLDFEISVFNRRFSDVSLI